MGPAAKREVRSNERSNEARVKRGKGRKTKEGRTGRRNTEAAPNRTSAREQETKGKQSMRYQLTVRRCI